MSTSTHRENQITEIVIGLAIELHRQLGPGLLESVYETILEMKLKKLGFKVERQKPIPLQYEEIFIPEAFKADLIIDDLVILELKSIETLNKAHKKQLLTYLKLTGLHVGLLINFGAPVLINGLERIVNNLPEDAGDLDEVGL